MTLTAWKTWASGDILTAADMNTYTRDNGRWLSHNATGGAPMVRAFNTANISTATGTLVAVAANSERFDIGTMHDNVTNNSRMTIPASSGGKYLIGGSIRWGPHADTSDRVIHVLLNGATFVAVSSMAAVSGFTMYQSISTLYALAAADYVEIAGLQDSVTTINMESAGNYSPEIWAIWMGE